MHLFEQWAICEKYDMALSLYTIPNT